MTEFPAAFGIGLALVPDAAALAKTNAARLGLNNRSAFLAGNWTLSISGRFDLVISNPPYIPGSAIDALMPEVARHEPRSALDGGSDGYDAYRAIVPLLAPLLEPAGVAILELGIGQAQYVSCLTREAGFDVSIRHDLARIPRAITLTWPNR